MYCKECGTQIDDDSKFCPKCGAKQSSNIKQPDGVMKTKVVQSKEHIGNGIQNLRSNPSKQKSPLDEKYDKSYKRDISPIIVGLIWWVICFLLLEYGSEMETSFQNVLGVLSIIILIILSYWGWNIAKSKNRDEITWAVFVFFLAPIALIILGFQKKFLHTSYYFAMDDKGKSMENVRIAKNMRQSGLLEESLIFSTTALEQDSENAEAFFNNGYTNYLLGNYEESLRNIDDSIMINPNDANTYYQRGLVYEKIGNTKKMLKDWEVAIKMGHSIAKMKIKKFNN